MSFLLKVFTSAEFKHYNTISCGCMLYLEEMLPLPSCMKVHGKELETTQCITLLGQAEVVTQTTTIKVVLSQ